jgi:hypothetical protein
MNSTKQDISVSGVGSIRDANLEEVLSSYILLSLSVICLFLRIVGLSHLEMLAPDCWWSLATPDTQDSTSSHGTPQHH